VQELQFSQATQAVPLVAADRSTHRHPRLGVVNALTVRQYAVFVRKTSAISFSRVAFSSRTRAGSAGTSTTNRLPAAGSARTGSSRRWPPRVPARCKAESGAAGVGAPRSAPAEPLEQVRHEVRGHPLAPVGRRRSPPARRSSGPTWYPHLPVAVLAGVAEQVGQDLLEVPRVGQHRDTRSTSTRTASAARRRPGDGASRPRVGHRLVHRIGPDAGAGRPRRSRSASHLLDEVHHRVRPGTPGPPRGRFLASARCSQPSSEQLAVAVISAELPDVVRQQATRSAVRCWAARSASLAPSSRRPGGQFDPDPALVGLPAAPLPEQAPPRSPHAARLARTRAHSPTPNRNRTARSPERDPAADRGLRDGLVEDVAATAATSATTCRPPGRVVAPLLVLVGEPASRGARTLSPAPARDRALVEPDTVWFEPTTVPSPSTRYTWLPRARSRAAGTRPAGWTGCRRRRRRSAVRSSSRTAPRTQPPHPAATEGTTAGRRPVVGERGADVGYRPSCRRRSGRGSRARCAAPCPRRVQQDRGRIAEGRDRLFERAWSTCGPAGTASAWTRSRAMRSATYVATKSTR
jgi:hypothetical protein